MQSDLQVGFWKGILENVWTESRVVCREALVSRGDVSGADWSSSSSCHGWGPLVAGTSALLLWLTESYKDEPG